MTDSSLSLEHSIGLRHAIKASYHEILILLVTSTSAAACMVLDQNTPLFWQNLLGLCAWSVLLLFLMHESRQVQAQVLVAVAFATLGEYFASPFMGGYTYRLANVPAFVPPGHGMIYLTAVALGRSVFFQKYYQQLLRTAVVGGGLWVVWGLTLATQQDVLGAILFTVFLLFLWLGKSAPVYLGAFYITTYLEWVGTLAGTWSWAPIDPVTGLAQGNPPSGVAAWYCLVDAVALISAPLVISVLKLSRHWWLARMLIRLEGWGIKRIGFAIQTLRGLVDKVDARILAK